MGRLLLSAKVPVSLSLSDSDSGSGSDSDSDSLSDTCLREFSEKSSGMSQWDDCYCPPKCRSVLV